MLRLLNLVLVLGVLSSAFVLYTLEHATRGAERRIARLEARIDNERESIKLLHAEWSNLARPERLQKLAEEHLKLKPISPDQLMTLDELAARVPPEPIIKLEEKGKDPIGDILKKMD